MPKDSPTPPSLGGSGGIWTRPKLTSQERVQIIAAATSEPAGAGTVRAHQLLAEDLALAGVTVSASQIGRIFDQAGLKPHLVRGWLTRPADPGFFTKATDVCGLYRHQPPASVVLPVDEKTGITARSRKHPGRPGRPGRRTRREFEYVRHGTVSIIAALGVHTGQVLTQTIERNNADTFIEFLRLIDSSLAPGLDIRLVLDNGSPHTAKKTKAWLAPTKGSTCTGPPTMRPG